MWRIGTSAHASLNLAENWAPVDLKLYPVQMRLFLEDCDEEKGFDYV